jgi:tripartite-type tricarboxylate transporter receptor subunit TctC
LLHNVLAASSLLMITMNVMPLRAEVTFNRPIRFVIPFGPGGDTDLLARVVATNLKTLGQPVIAENRPGAAGTVATMAVLGAPADGHTMLFSATSIFINPVLYKSLPFDAQKDLAPVATIGRIAWGLMANERFPASNLAELVRAAKANPGKFKYSSSGTGGTAHLSFELFNKAAGLNIIHVAYKSGAESNTALLSNEVDLTLNNAAFARSHAARIKLLAMTGDERTAEDPNVPTLRENGIDLSEYVWMGVVVSSRTPAPIIAALNAAINDALRTPEVVDFISKRMGYEIRRESPQETGRFMRGEFTKWADAARLANIKPSE